MEKQKTAKELNQKLNQLIKRNEPSSVQKDCKQALSSRRAIDKEVAISKYNAWLRS